MKRLCFQKKSRSQNATFSFRSPQNVFKYGVVFVVLQRVQGDQWRLPGIGRRVKDHESIKKKKEKKKKKRKKKTHPARLELGKNWITKQDFNHCAT